MRLLLYIPVQPPKIRRKGVHRMPYEQDRPLHLLTPRYKPPIVRRVVRFDRDEVRVPVRGEIVARFETGERFDELPGEFAAGSGEGGGECGGDGGGLDGVD